MDKSASFSRRQALGLGAAGAITLFGLPALLSACTTGGTAKTLSIGLGPELANPPVRTASGGKLGGTLTAKWGEVDLGLGRPVKTYVYNGAIPGETWDLNPGETIAIELVNDLPPLTSSQQAESDDHHQIGAETGSQGAANLTRPHAWTTTNLHTHGLHVSPSDTEEGAGDNVFLVLEPGGRQRYNITIPDDHTGGFFWYHPHHHGGVKQQVRGGLAGALIIRGEIDDVPEVAAATERIFVLQNIELTGEFTLAEPLPEDPNGNYWPDAQEFWIINGQYRPTVTMQPGEVQRWRFVNAAASTMALVSLAGHPLNILAYDGYTLDAPEVTDAIELVPGGRVELLVKAGDIGMYDLTLLPGDQTPITPPTPGSDGYTGASSLSRTIATIVIEGAQLDMGLPKTLPAYDTSVLPIAKKRSVNWESITDAKGNFLALGVDHEAFDPDTPPYQMQLGTAEEWHVEDMDDGFTHIFHIHINPFLVTEINGQPLAKPQWRDTFPLGPHDFTMQMNLVDFTGKYVDHCHYVDHEDMGMMEAVEVVDT